MKRVGNGESGAVAVIVSVFIAFVAVIAAAIVVDLGGLWSTQRGLVIDTDSMALAGARAASFELDSCAEAETAANRAVDELGVLNDVESVSGVAVDCVAGRRFGTVRVDADQGSPGWFSGQPLSAGGTSTAVFERSSPPLPGLSFCENQFSDLGVDLGPVTLAYRFTSELPEGKGCPIGRPGAPITSGGWGWLVNDGSEDWIYGLPSSCQTAYGPNWCLGTTGTNLINTDFVERGDEFVFPLFNESDGRGRSSDPTRFNLVGFGVGTLLGCSQSPSLAGLATGACQGAVRWISVDVENLWRFGDDIDEDPRLSILRTSICGVRAGSSCPS
jgi:hypothetical protein